MRKPSSFFGKKAIIFIAFVLTVWVVFSLLNNWVLDRASDHYLADGVVRIELPSGRKLNIPERYMYWEGFIKHGRWPRPKEGRVKVEAFNFDALLPDLRPFRAEDKAKWEELGLGNRASIYIQKRPADGETIKDIFSFLMERADGGYTKYLGENENLLTFVNYGFRNGELKASSKTYFDTDLSIMIRCDDFNSEFISPGCNIRYIIDENNYLDYTYSYKYFSKSIETHNLILELLKEFESSAKA